MKDIPHVTIATNGLSEKEVPALKGMRREGRLRKCITKEGKTKEWAVLGVDSYSKKGQTPKAPMVW